MMCLAQFLVSKLLNCCKFSKWVSGSVFKGPIWLRFSSESNCISDSSSHALSLLTKGPAHIFETLLDHLYHLIFWSFFRPEAITNCRWPLQHYCQLKRVKNIWCPGCAHIWQYGITFLFAKDKQIIFEIQQIKTDFVRKSVRQNVELGFWVKSWLVSAKSRDCGWEPAQVSGNKKGELGKYGRGERMQCNMSEMESTLWEKRRRGHLMVIRKVNTRKQWVRWNQHEADKHCEKSEGGGT